PHVGDYVIDLVRREQFAEGGHDLREGARRPSMDDHVFPRRVGLRSGLIATAEDRKSVGPPELRQRLRCAIPAGSVTSDASRLVNALAVLDIMGPLLDGLGEEKNRARKNNQQGRAQYRPYQDRATRVIRPNG